MVVVYLVHQLAIPAAGAVEAEVAPMEVAGEEGGEEKEEEAEVKEAREEVEGAVVVSDTSAANTAPLDVVGMDVE